MRKFLILGLALIFAFPACEKIKQHFAEHGHSHGGGSSNGKIELSLDNGKKWDADDHTMERISSMRNHIAAAGSASGSELPGSAYTDIQKNLNGEVKDLIQGCKMTGPAHDELHKYLEILIPEIENLNRGDVVVSKTSLQNIDALLNKFQNYFE